MKKNYTHDTEKCAVQMPIKAANGYPSIWQAIQAIAPRLMAQLKR